MLVKNNNYNLNHLLYNKSLGLVVCVLKIIKRHLKILDKEDSAIYLKTYQVTSIQSREV